MEQQIEKVGFSYSRVSQLFSTRLLTSPYTKFHSYWTAISYSSKYSLMDIYVWDLNWEFLKILKLLDKISHNWKLLSCFTPPFLLKDKWNSHPWQYCILSSLLFDTFVILKFAPYHLLCKYFYLFYKFYSFCQK